MAKQTAEQRKAAAKKAAAARAANAAKTQETATPSAAKASTEAQAQTGAQTSTGETQANGDQQQGPGNTQEQETPSVFDQAVAFAMNGVDDGRTVEGAKAHWDAFGCEAMPAKLAVAVLDCVVHQGSKATLALLAKVGGAFKDDQLTPDSIETLAECDEGELVAEFLAWRLRRYAFTANAATRMWGWSQHILKLQTFVLCDLQA